MKKFLTVHQLMRYFSVLLLLSALILLFWVHADKCDEYVCILAVSANVLLQLYPLAYQNNKMSLLWSGIYFPLIGVMSFLGADIGLVLLLVCMFLLSYMIYRCVRRFRTARSLFCSNNIIVFVRDYAQLFYCTVFFVVVLAVVVLWHYIGLWSLFLPLSLYPAQYYRAYTTRTLFVSATYERQVFEISRGQIRGISNDVAVNINDSRMEAIYAKAVDLMENQKMFLDPSYSIYDLAHQTGTNKSYISRVVNIYSGQNFCKFLNWYRIRYAASYVNDNPSVRVTELALKSGFNSNVTFTSAFRMFMGCSPGDYIMQVSRLGK